VENSRYLIFTSAGRSFSLPFEDIKIIIAAQTPTPVPDFPDYVPGIKFYGKKGTDPQRSVPFTFYNVMLSSDGRPGKSGQ
jgi:hypothetical protein